MRSDQSRLWLTYPWIGLLQDHRSPQSVTHEVLSTFMLEVCAIVNSRPIANISSDPSDPIVLTPSMLLTQKTENVPSISEDLDLKDVYKARWKHVQVFSDTFWKRWRDTYLQSLQQRQKWHSERRDLKVGDVVLLKDCDVPRINWPVGLVVEVFESEDGRVRKVVVRVGKNGSFVNYTRPITETVLLLE